MHHHRRASTLTAFLVAAALAGCSLVEGTPGASPSSPEPTAQVEATPAQKAPSASTDPSSSTDPSASTDPAPSQEPSSSPQPSSSPSPTPSPSPTSEPEAAARAPQSSLAYLPGADAGTLSIAAARAFWLTAPFVVVGPAKDRDAIEAAEQAGVPMLVPSEGAPDAVHEELARLATTAVLSFDPAFEAPEGVELLSPEDELPAASVLPAMPGVVVLEDGSARSRAAAQTARSAGAQVITARGGDPRAARELVAAFAEGAPISSVTALGDRFAGPEVLAERMRVVRTGVTLPSGGQLVFDRTRYVALYGSPLTPALGVLGEQGVKQSVKRARGLTKPYAKLVDDDVVPMFEIIATVASAGKGSDGNYSNELDIDSIRPYVAEARAKGVYVLLDLQPGRTDFLTQAKLYEELLLEPHVGLALDPEWRLKKNQVHLRQIGSVGIKEVNRVGDYLADLVAANDLPQKMFVLHQFTTSMIRNRDKLDTSRSELAYVVHVDGQGALGSKYGTWAHLRKGAPKGLYWGWKNFYDEDKPMATPKQTVAVDPTPDLITYQ